MIKKCTTPEEMRQLEAEIHYFYTHGGPVMEEGTLDTTETVLVSAAGKRGGKLHEDTNWRNIVKGGLEAEITYFYNHGGPAMY